MRRFSTAALAIFIALVFLAYMVSYTVAYDEIVVKTRFGAAGENAVVTEPGWHPRMPWPIDRVHTYPTQIQVLQDNPEQILLKDGNSVVINMVVYWHISNPLDFYKSLRTIEGDSGAENALKSQMQNLRSVVTQYNFNQLVNPDETKVEMAQLETEIATRFQAALDAIQPSYGITIDRVSMGRLQYTESTATKVNERMSATQAALATVILGEGTAEAGNITSAAQADSEIILQFAGTVAAQIRSVGRNEVAEFLKLFAANPDLATFLRQIEAAERIMANRSTFVIDTRQINPFNVYMMGPGPADDISRIGELNMPGEGQARRPMPLRPDLPDTAPTASEARP